MPTFWLWWELLMLPEDIHNRNSMHDIFTHLGMVMLKTNVACQSTFLFEDQQSEYKIPNTFFDPSEQEKTKPDLSVNAFHLSLHREGMRSGGGGPPRHPYAAPPLQSKDLWVILQLSLRSIVCVWTAAQGKRFWTQASMHAGMYQARKHEATHMNARTHTHTLHSSTWASNLCSVSWT